jgi:hypothetical protein
MIRRRIIAQGMATERAIHLGVDHLASPEKQYTKNTELQSRLSPQEMQPLWLRVSELIRSDRMNRIQIRGQRSEPRTRHRAGGQAHADPSTDSTGSPQ